MGAPDNPEEYIRFDSDDLTVYVARALLEKLEAGATEQPSILTATAGIHSSLMGRGEVRSELQGVEARD